MLEGFDEVRNFTRGTFFKRHLEVHCI